jgi:hypothetical protein
VTPGPSAAQRWQKDRRRLEGVGNPGQRFAGRPPRRKTPGLLHEKTHALIARARETESLGLVADLTADLGCAQISRRESVEE